jgi:hypothetical protein
MADLSHDQVLRADGARAACCVNSHLASRLLSNMSWQEDDMTFDLNAAELHFRSGAWKRNALARPVHCDRNRHANKAAVTAPRQAETSAAPRASWKALLAHRAKCDLAAELSIAFFRPKARDASFLSAEPVQRLRASLRSLPQKPASPARQGAPRCDRPIFTSGRVLIAVTSGNAAPKSAECEPLSAGRSLQKAA